MSRFRILRSQRRASSIAAALVLAALLAACGGSTPRAQPTPTTTTPTTGQPTATPTETKKPGGQSSTPASVKPSASKKPTPGSTSPGSSATLDLACARRGVDVQGVTVMTKPGGPAGYNTLYSDGSSSVDGKSSYSDGFGGGFADDQGRFRDTFTVPSNAPLGVATVRIVTQDGGIDVKYTVVAQNGSCPS
jgi:hypothetical protein